MKTLGPLIIVVIFLTMYPSMHTYGHPNEQTIKTYFEKQFSSDPLPISAAVLDKSTGFLFLKLLIPYTDNGGCAAPSNFVFQHIAYPLSKILKNLRDKYNSLIVSYAVNSTSVQYIPKGFCSTYSDGIFIHDTFTTPSKKPALLAEELLVLFPHGDNLMQWKEKIIKTSEEIRNEKIKQIQRLGKGMVPLQAR